MPNETSAAAVAGRAATGVGGGAVENREGNVTLRVNGVAVSVPAGMTIKCAAERAGATVPTLCFLARRNAIGSCRVCSVEVEGQDALVTACNTPVREGMSVVTDSSRVVEYRREMLRLILSDHHLDSTAFCFSCAKNGQCELQALCRAYGVTEPTYTNGRPREAVLDSNPFLRYDPNLCIHCQRCVGACNNAAHNHTLHTGHQGRRLTIEAPFGPDWKATECESCGNCAQACPTGALVEKRMDGYRAWEVSKVRSTCPHCAVGCQIDFVVKDGRIVDAQAAPGPSNRSMLCVKGRSGSFDYIDAPDRLRTPLIKNRETGKFEPASWDEALDLVASRFGEIKRREGGDALAAFACSRSTNEDIYMLEKMARCAFGTNNIDNCARV